MRSRLLFLSLLLAIALFALCSASSPSHHPQASLRGSDASTTVQTRPVLVGITSGTEARTSPSPRRSGGVARAKPVITRPARSTEASPSAPAHAPIPPAHDGYHGSVPDLIRSVFGSAADCALRIAYRESRFNPRAYNHSGASGVFQLMRIWYDGRWHFDPFNAWLNVHYAHEMYQDYGFGPWGGCP